ncbi:MAG: DUF3857 domain-containing protein [Planctomycetota bacterium]|nr:DUF3857 domain-containing protein [Planctomycetota bacterium]
MIRLPTRVSARSRCTLPRRSSLRTRAVAGLLAAVTTLPVARTQEPDSSRKAALDFLSRGQNVAAAIAFTDLAQRTMALDDAEHALAAEAYVALAIQLHQRHPEYQQLVDRILKLRESPLATREPDLADQIGVMTLGYLRDSGDDRTEELARTLGFVNDLWVCGPFENERGAAHRRELAAETELLLDSTYPGKQLPVQWRRLQNKAPRGSLLLSGILRPTEQIACLTATAVIADADQTAAVHVGSSGSFVVRLNGAVVAERDVERRFAFDQDVVALPLKAGANLLVVKFGHQESGPFLASLRISAPLGGPATGVRVSGDPKDLEAAAQTTPSTAEVQTPSQGARSRLGVDQARGYDALWLGLLWHLCSADGDVERRDRQLAERAVADLPEEPQARMLLAATRTRQARLSAEIDANERRHDYETILAQDPEHVGAATQLGQLLLQSMSLKSQAEKLARQALAVNPDNSMARFLLSRTLLAADLEELSLRASLQATAQPTISAMLSTVAAQLVDNQRWEEAGKLFTRLGTSSGRPSHMLAVANFHLHHGDRETAKTFIDRATALEPLSRWPFVMRAELFEGEGDFEAALQEYSRWLELCPHDDEAMAEQSRLYGRLGQVEQQIERLRAAIACNPNRRHDQRYLEFLAAEAAPFYDPWQLDTTELLAVETPANSIESKDPFYHLLRQTVVHAHQNGTRSQYIRICLRVLSEAGARGLSSFRLPYYQREQRARLLSCTIHKASGATERPRLRGAQVELRALQPGDEIDIEGRIDDLMPSFFGDYFGLQHFLKPPDGNACHRSDLVVIADPGRNYQYQLTGGAPEPRVEQREDGTRVFTFSAADLPREVPQPLQPGSKERQPLVRFSTFEDWDAFTAWYWNLIRGQIETSPAMQQTVRELTAECSSDEERVAAIYRFVTTDVRYEAWEFGVHGYKPYNTSVIFDRRHGDCKDKALLLCALLAEVDIESRPVLIFADPRRTRDDLPLPMVEHFNHCIAWLPQQGDLEARFLDCTATWHPADLVPDMDQGADVLIVDGSRALLDRVPEVTPDENGLDITFMVDLRTDGGADIRQTQRPRGNAAVGLRSALATEPSRRREGVERSLVPLFGPLTLRNIEASDPLQLDEPVELTVDLEVGALGQRSGSNWQLPSMFGRDPLLSLPLIDKEKRTQPLLLSVPQRDRRTIRYRIPAGFRVESLPEDMTRSSPFGSFQMTWRSEGSEVTVERVMTLQSSRIAVADYEEFGEFLESLRAADARVVILGQERNR